MDREAVAACVAVGVGATVTLSVGGKHDRLHGEPVAVTGMVRLIHEGAFTIGGAMGRGTRASRGRTVVLEIDDEDPIFEHLDYAPSARDYDLPRAAGQ